MSDTTATVTAPAYTKGPVDACDEGAYRINFILEMIHAAEDPREKDAGGFEYSMIREALAAVRDLLREASANDGKASA